MCDHLNIKIGKAKIMKDQNLLKELSDQLELDHRKAKVGQESQRKIMVFISSLATGSTYTQTLN